MASIRTRKKQVVIHLMMAFWGRKLEAWLNAPEAAKPEKVSSFLQSRSFHLGEYDALQTAADDNVKLEYVVQKVNGGEVVDTFDTREAALALVLKHARQKKAKLQVMYSTTGELVLFSEEEMAV